MLHKAKICLCLAFMISPLFSQPIQVTDIIHVSGEHPYALRGFGDLLSPDGTKYIINDDKCQYFKVYSVKGDLLMTVNLGRDIAIEGIEWSPDSSKIAFTEGIRFGRYESDIYIADVDKKEFSDYTEDHVTGQFIFESPSPRLLGIPQDEYPHWNDKGDSVYFLYE
jgi:Tol biopolymer transport system component